MSQDAYLGLRVVRSHGRNDKAGSPSRRPAFFTHASLFPSFPDLRGHSSNGCPSAGKPRGSPPMGKFHTCWVGTCFSAWGKTISRVRSLLIDSLEKQGPHRPGSPLVPQRTVQNSGLSSLFSLNLRHGPRNVSLRQWSPSLRSETVERWVRGAVTCHVPIGIGLVRIDPVRSITFLPTSPHLIY